MYDDDWKLKWRVNSEDVRWLFTKDQQVQRGSVPLSARVTVTILYCSEDEALKEYCCKWVYFYSLIFIFNEKGNMLTGYRLSQPFIFRLFFLVAVLIFEQVHTQFGLDLYRYLWLTGLFPCGSVETFPVIVRWSPDPPVWPLVSAYSSWSDFILIWIIYVLNWKILTGREIYLYFVDVINIPL